MQKLLSFPCGTVEMNERNIDAIIREVREETMIKLSLNDNIYFLGSYNPNPAYFTNIMSLYLVELSSDKFDEYYNNRVKQELDEDEDCEVFIDYFKNQKYELRKNAMSLVAWSCFDDYMHKYMGVIYNEYYKI